MLVHVCRLFRDGCQQMLHPHASSKPFYIAGPSGLFQVGGKFLFRSDSLILQELQHGNTMSLLRLEERK